MEILLVRNIVKLLNIRIIPLIPFRKLLVPDPVWNREAESETENDENFTSSRDHTDDDSRLVFWCFLVQKGIWPDDVAYCNSLLSQLNQTKIGVIYDKDGGGRKGLFGCSSYISSYEGQSKDECSVG